MSNRKSLFIKRVIVSIILSLVSFLVIGIVIQNTIMYKRFHSSHNYYSYTKDIYDDLIIYLINLEKCGFEVNDGIYYGYSEHQNSTNNFNIIQYDGSFYDMSLYLDNQMDFNSQGCYYIYEIKDRKIIQVYYSKSIVLIYLLKKQYLPFEHNDESTIGDRFLGFPFFGFPLIPKYGIEIDTAKKYEYNSNVVLNSEVDHYLIDIIIKNLFFVISLSFFTIFLWFVFIGKILSVLDKNKIKKVN